MKQERLSPSSPSVRLEHSPGNATADCDRIYKQMRGVIADVFPNDSAAWQWTSERGATSRIDPPPANAGTWLKSKFQAATPFAKQLIARQFTQWRSFEQRDWEANDKKAYEHQRALYAWITIAGMCDGVRDKLPAILVRSPYGTGKSLVGGMVGESLAEEMHYQLAQGTPRGEIPRELVLGLRQDLLLQNAVGERYRALRPPYTVEESHVRAFHKQLTQLHGDAFVKLFPQPRGKSDPWYELFLESDEDPENRLTAYFKAKGVDAKGNRGLVNDVLALMTGEGILRPDHHNIPRMHPAPERAIDLERQGFRGDLAYALDPELGVLATHKHLLPDPTKYTRFHEESDDAALIGIAHGTTVTRDPLKIREDFAKQILASKKLVMVVDEAGKYNPNALRHSAEYLSKRAPMLLGFTGQDKGVEGWVRSPNMSIDRSIELGLTKPVAFSFVGSQEKSFPQGSEGAWKQYAEQFFASAPIATALKLRQPWDSDGFIVVPPDKVWEYGHRIAALYEANGKAVDVSCYDSKLGQDRWKVMEDTLRIPRKKGEPPRKIVAPGGQVAIGLDVPIDSIDVLCALREPDMDQLLGRLFHQRKLGGRQEDRTYFRQQVVDETNFIELRKIAKELGFALPETAARWRNLQCGVDLKAKKADDKRAKKFGPPQDVPDARRPRADKTPKRSADDLQSMEITSPYLLRLQEEKEQRLMAKGMAAAGVETRNGTPSNVISGKAKIMGKESTVVLEVDAHGKPLASSIAELARRHGLTSLEGALKSFVDMKYSDTLRGEALAKAVGGKVHTMLETRARRSMASRASESADW